MNLFSTDHLPGRTVRTQQGEEYLWFSGTDYLGMGHNEEFRSYLTEATKDYGMHFGSSRNGSLQLPIYEKAEQAFAHFSGAESALLVSSGMWAGQLVLKNIEDITSEESRPGKIFYHYAPKIHPALWGNNFIQNLQVWQDWALEIVDRINNGNSSEIHIICSDAIGSPLVETFDFSIFGQIQKSGLVWLIIDESHSLGVLGQNGIGVKALVPDFLIGHTIFVSSLNKALGIPAGAIWGSRKVINTIRQSPWFAGASPPAPAYINAFHQILKIGLYQSLSRQLIAQISHFADRLPVQNLFLSAPEYPVFCSQSADLYKYLLQNGIMASCFSYPSPTDLPVTRIAISTFHQKEDLDRLAEVCIKFKN